MGGYTVPPVTAGSEDGGGQMSRVAAGQMPLGVMGCMRRRAASVTEPDREG